MLIPFTQTPDVATSEPQDNPLNIEHRAELASSDEAYNNAQAELAEIRGERGAIAVPLVEAKKELERAERAMKGAYIEAGARADLETAKFRLETLERKDAKYREQSEVIKAQSYETGLASGALRGWVEMNLTSQQVSDLKAARDAGQSIESLNNRAKNLAYSNEMKVQPVASGAAIGERTESGNVRW